MLPRPILTLFLLLLFICLLCCFFLKHSQDAAPKGKIEIPGESTIAPSADKPHCWRLTTPEVPTGMLMRAPDAKSKRKWVTAMRAAISAQSSTTIVHNEDTLRASGLSAMDLM